MKQKQVVSTMISFFSEKLNGFRESKHKEQRIKTLPFLFLFLQNNFHPPIEKCEFENDSLIYFQRLNKCKFR